MKEPKNQKTTAIRKTQVYNLIILDKSGSMYSIRNEAVNGFNETLGSIRAAQKQHADSQDHFISLAVFCGCKVEMIYDKTPIAQAKNMTQKSYEPCCTTPLLDAIGKSVSDLKSHVKNAEDAVALVTIITDGYENASMEWDAVSVKKLIDDLKEEGWMFSFIGAGRDIVEAASTISITNTVVWEKTSAGTDAIFKNENIARLRYFNRMASFAKRNLSHDGMVACRADLSRAYYDDDFSMDQDAPEKSNK